MRILFIHGRAQGGKDEDALKDTWIKTLKEGFDRAKIPFPDNIKFDFPFYGDILDNLVNKPRVEDVRSKGASIDQSYELFLKEAINDIYEHSSITESDILKELQDGDATEKGIENWGWIHAIVKAIDRKYTGVSKYFIEKYLEDVHLYISSRGVSTQINSVIENFITNEPTIIVGHSLGSVIGYNVINDNLGQLGRFKYVTIGSPLGIRAINKKIKSPFKNHAELGWYNAYDDDDIVALNPLDNNNFPVTPNIENYGKVKNNTGNQHGIKGYLNDPHTARIFAEAISALKST